MSWVVVPWARCSWQPAVGSNGTVEWSIGGDCWNCLSARSGTTDNCSRVEAAGIGRRIEFTMLYCLSLHINLEYFVSAVYDVLHLAVLNRQLLLLPSSAFRLLLLRMLIVRVLFKFFRQLMMFLLWLR